MQNNTPLLALTVVATAALTAQRFVTATGAQTGACLDQDLVLVMHQFLDRGRHQANAIFVFLDFLGDADPHNKVLTFKPLP